ncbi:ATPase family protein associated with various cellular activities (AAA) [Thioclava sp. ES.031]|uniref:AAA family ATPase n=1 Tax=Thioclava sp. ES.031 TaxID=1798203 RepID=UPI000BF6A715|nr:AAA family ATPase [Thioclava sp. ES.031]PFG62165.1 ATPase family protein associated with various cellular activities (AAA) [Thioclava sp. ES.031]
MPQKRVQVLFQKPISSSHSRQSVTNAVNGDFAIRSGRMFPPDADDVEVDDFFAEDEDLWKAGERRRRINRAVERLVDQKFNGTFEVDKNISDRSVKRLHHLYTHGARLAGPETAESVYELAASLHAEAPWLDQVSTSIMNQGLAHVASGGVGLRFDPMILVGAPGCGKTHFARLVADLARTPREIIDVGAGGAGFRIAGVEHGWASARSGVPVELITATAVANPVIVVDEVCKAGGAINSSYRSATSLTTSLLQVLERSSAEHFTCPFLRTRIDMSHVNWILTANYEHQIPAPLLDRCQVFRVDVSKPAHLVAFFKRAAGDDVEHDEMERVRVFVEEMCEIGRPPSLRQMGRMARTMRQCGRRNLL